MSREVSDLQDEIIEDIIVEDEVHQDDIDVGDVTYVCIVYNGGETDNIVVNVDNDNRIITATVKPIQFVSRETFPEIGSDKLLYTDNSENAIYRWDTERSDYVLVGKDYTLDIISFRHDIDQNQMDISANRQAIADNKSEIDRLEREKITQAQMEDYTYDKQTIDDAIDDLDSDFTNLNQRVTDLEDEVETNTADIASNRSLIDANSQSIQQNKDAIETNSRSILELQDGSGNSFEISVDPTTYILTLNLKNKAGKTISTGNVDLPLETMVVDVKLKDNNTLTLTLQNGQTVDIDVSSLVSGLVSEQTFNDEITRLDGEITTLQGEVTAHDLTLTSIEEANKDRDIKINALETKSAEHEQELADYEVRIGESENAISDLQEQADATDEGLTNLIARVSTNEAFISDIKQEQITQNDSISGLTNGLATVNENIAKLQEKTDSSDTNIEELTQRVATNETNIASNTSNIEALNTKTDTTNQNVSDLSDRVNEHDTLISQKANQTELTSTAEALRDEIGKKQDKLTAGANITITDTNVIRANIPDETDPTVPQHVKDITEGDIVNWNAKIDQDGLEAYAYDKKTVDSKITETNSSVSDLSTKYTALETRVSNNTKSIDGHTTDISGLKSGLETANSNITDLQGSVKTAQSDITDLQADVTDIQGKIPTQASATNQLVDKNFMNSTVNSLAAFYITKNAKGEPFATNAELVGTTTYYSGGQIRVPTTNDYCIVQSDETKADELGDHPTTRYTYQGGQWEFQYIVNRTALTAEQIAAINSKITAELVSQIGTNKSSITSLTSRVGAVETKNTSQDTSISVLQTTKADKTEIPRPLWLADSVILTDAGIDADYTIPKKNIQPLVATGYTIMASDKIMFMTEKATYLGVVKSTNGDNVVATPKFDMATVGYVEKNAGGGADGAVLYTEQTLTTDQQSQARKNIGAGTSNFDGSYNSLSNRPTIGNATLTIQKEGTSIGTFTANASTDKAINVVESDPTVPSHVKSITSTNISTWNNGATNNVKYTEQTLTDTQKAQARTNIGAGTSNFDGKYGSLSGTPTLGSLASKSAITSADITDGTIVNADISTSAAIAQSKIANLTTDLASKATTTALNAVKTTADNAMPKSGGQFTGRVSWNATSLPALSSPQYFVTIEPFASGGKTYYSTISEAKSALGVTAVETKNASQDTAIAKAQTSADDAASAAAAAQSTANAKYTKPSAGIPASDLAGAIPTSKITGLGSLATKSAITSADITDGTIVNADIASNAAIAVSKISGLGSLATKSTITSAEITDGTIMNADINANAAIAQSKISGLTAALTAKYTKPSGGIPKTDLASDVQSALDSAASVVGEWITLYDKDSDDPAINKGEPDGLRYENSANILGGIDFNPYKKLRILYYPIENQTYYEFNLEEFKNAPDLSPTHTYSFVAYYQNYTGLAHSVVSIIAEKGANGEFLLSLYHFYQINIKNKAYPVVKCVDDDHLYFIAKVQVQ